MDKYKCWFRQKANHHTYGGFHSPNATRSIRSSVFSVLGLNVIASDFKCIRISMLLTKNKSHDFKYLIDKDISNVEKGNIVFAYFILFYFLGELQNILLYIMFILKMPNSVYTKLDSLSKRY